MLCLSIVVVVVVVVVVVLVVLQLENRIKEYFIILGRISHREDDAQSLSLGE